MAQRLLSLAMKTSWPLSTPWSEQKGRFTQEPTASATNPANQNSHATKAFYSHKNAVLVRFQNPYNMRLQTSKDLK